VDLALKWLDEFKVQLLPVTENNHYKGMFSEDLFLDQEGAPEETVGAYPLLHTSHFVQHDQHVLEVIRLGLSQHMGMVPVLDGAGNYLGLINLSQPSSILEKVTSASQLGGILELRMAEKDYSMSHLSRLIEADDVKILSSVVQPYPEDPSQIVLTLKLNKTDLARVIATLERFGYIITARHHQSELVGNEQDRLGLLLKYLSL
jgi:hypothetical protein